MKRTSLRRTRPTPRKGEPTSAEKQAARVACYERAKGICELHVSPDCRVRMPLNLGHLHHERAKRRWGWMESANQRHLWVCPQCHAYEHAGRKPCPPKAKPLAAEGSL